MRGWEIEREIEREKRENDRVVTASRWESAQEKR